MKRIIFLIILLLGNLCTYAKTFSYAYEGSLLYFEVIDEEQKTARITQRPYGCPLAEDLIIPPIALDSESIEYSVTVIGKKAFAGSSLIKSVFIPNTVTSIEQEAFSSCSALESINIPESVTSIASFTFSQCTALQSITIPNSVTSIEPSAFSGCWKLKSINIPESVTSIEKYTFRDCWALTSIKIPNSVISIVDYAFEGCSALESIAIPESVTSIGKGAFNRCYNMKEVYIEDGTTTLKFIDGSSFYDAINTLYLGRNIECGSTLSSYKKTPFWEHSKLKKLAIGKYVTSIGDETFSGCTSLSSVVIPQGVSTIGDKAFYGCNNLEEVKIEDGENPIVLGGYVFDSRDATKPWRLYLGRDFIGETTGFRNIAGLKEVIIGDCVTTIGNDAFYGCSALSSVNISNSVTTIGKNAFNDCSALTSIKIPNSVISIGDFAFAGCSALESIAIPESVTSISKGAFQRCINLKEVYIEDGTTTLKFIDGSPFNKAMHTLYLGRNIEYDSSPFWYNSNLKKIVIGKYVTSTGDNAFSGCTSLTSVVIPQGVSTIGDKAFYGCNNLEEVKIEDGESPLMLGKNVFYSRDATKPWRLYLGRDVICETSGFQNIAVLKEVIIGDCVTTIGNYAFSGCSSLSSVSIPNFVTTIGNYAFSYCRALESITIPESVTSIGNGAFDNCISLTSIIIPESVTSIGDGAFYNCSSLTSVIIPESVTSIGDRAFYNCSSLTSVIIPDSVTEIKDYAFANCTGLTTIVLGKSVSSIGSWAFGGCENLENIFCRANNPAKVIGNYSPFGNISDNARLWVRSGRESEFKKSGYWKSLRIRKCKFSSDSYNCIGMYTDGIVMNVGSTYKIKFAVFTENDDDSTIIWTSDNEEVATVDSTGTVTAQSVGKSGIKATIGNLSSYSYFVTVINPESGVAITESPDTETQMHVYDINGLNISNSIDNLAPGIYFVRTGNSVKKIIVK